MNYEWHFPFFSNWFITSKYLLTDCLKSSEEFSSKLILIEQSPPSVPFCCNHFVRLKLQTSDTINSINFRVETSPLSRLRSRLLSRFTVSTSHVWPAQLSSSMKLKQSEQGSSLKTFRKKEIVTLKNAFYLFAISLNNVSSKTFEN